MPISTGRDHPARKTLTHKNLRAIQIPALDVDVALSSLSVSVAGNVDECDDCHICVFITTSTNTTTTTATTTTTTTIPVYFTIRFRLVECCF
jgi:hypothetical protein